MRAITVTSFALTILVAAGCSQVSSPTGPTFTRSAAEAAISGASTNGTSATDALPFTGRLDGTFTADDSRFPIVSVSLQAGGHATHLGRFTMTSVHDVDFLTFRSVPGSAAATLVAANGDQLFTTLEGEARPLEQPGVFLIEETYHITGGTGRFTGATGTFVLERTTTPPAPVFGTTEGSFTGTIVLRQGIQ